MYHKQGRDICPRCSLFNFLDYVTAIFQLVNLPHHIKMCINPTNVFSANIELMTRNQSKIQEIESYNWDTFDHKNISSLSLTFLVC